MLPRPARPTRHLPARALRATAGRWHRRRTVPVAEAGCRRCGSGMERGLTRCSMVRGIRVENCREVRTTVLRTPYRVQRLAFLSHECAYTSTRHTGQPYRVPYGAFLGLVRQSQYEVRRTQYGSCPD